MKFCLLLLLLVASPVSAAHRAWLGPEFYSAEGREREAKFNGSFLSDLRSINEVQAMSADQKLRFQQNQIEPTLKFIFGPLTNRAIGGPQRGITLKVDWNSARMERGRVLLAYQYDGIWIVDKNLPDQFTIPVPLNKRDLFTANWKKCTDSAPDHQTEWFYWYFWDPARVGCEHREGIEFQTVNVDLGAQTVNQPATFPEYEKMFRSTGTENKMRLTFAFGYIEDPEEPNPDSDYDQGIMEYRAFVEQVRRISGFRESLILQKEYRSSRNGETVIGHRFVGRIHGREILINVVAAAGIDQMELFAKSFAHDHDSFFGWFGHSRVGSGFDAERFGQMVLSDPGYYSVTANYQMVYWGGCNSYSYYTLPFFDFKSRVAGGADPKGTKGLDIIANGLPSYFMLNADNAAIVLSYLLNWQQKPSYQTIVDQIEARAHQVGINVLVAVLGDEDNPR